MTADPVEVRAARREETDDLLRVLCAAFRLPFDAARPIFYADPFFDLSHKRLLRTPEAGIVSCLTVIPTRIRVGGAWVPMAGIAGVATLPQFQGRGYAGRLLTATVPALHEELGYPLAGLFAHDQDYYRRFGWETVSQAVRYAGTLSDLPDCTEARHVRAVNVAADAAACELLRGLHQSLTAGRTGACERDGRRWRILAAAPERLWVIFQEQNQPPTGYAAYEWADTADGSVLRLLEMHGRTPTARRGLVGHLARQRDTVVRWDWPTSPEDYEAFDLPAHATSPEPGLMLRLTDTRAALAAVHAANLAPVLAASSRTLTVRAVDDLRPENTAPLRLTAAGVGPGDAADPDWVAADIRVLARCCFGSLTPSAAAAQGCLQASSPSVLALADALFPARAPFVAPLDQF